MVQCTEGGHGGTATKKSSPMIGGGGTAKKSKGLQKPLQIPWKSPSTESNDGDGDGFSFGRMMGMMMMQNRLDNKQREWQCCKPPRYVPYIGTYVPYDGTFGMPVQGQTLDV